VSTWFEACHIGGGASFQFFNHASLAKQPFDNISNLILDYTGVKRLSTKCSMMDVHKDALGVDGPPKPQKEGQQTTANNHEEGKLRLSRDLPADSRTELLTFTWGSCWGLVSFLKYSWKTTN
jgi:hypothetical protein